MQTPLGVISTKSLLQTKRKTGSRLISSNRRKQDVTPIDNAEHEPFSAARCRIFQRTNHTKKVDWRKLLFMLLNVCKIVLQRHNRVCDIYYILIVLFLFLVKVFFFCLNVKDMFACNIPISYVFCRQLILLHQNVRAAAACMDAKLYVERIMKYHGYCFSCVDFFLSMFIFWTQLSAVASEIFFATL